MNFPPRAFYSLTEIPQRWSDAVLADVAGWAAMGHLTLVTSITAVTCGRQPVAGIVEVSARDLMCMFRRHGPSEDQCFITRVRIPGHADWQYITDPAAGLRIQQSDLLLMADEVHRFEEERDLLRRMSNSTGAASRYDWEGAYLMLFRRINDHGLPATQGELISDVQDWFVQNSPNGEIPEESTTRKKIAPIWRALKGKDG